MDANSLFILTVGKIWKLEYKRLASDVVFYSSMNTKADLIPSFGDVNQRTLQETRQGDFGTVSLKPKGYYGFTGRLCI